MQLRLFLLALVLLSNLAAAPAKPTLAVSYFDNNSGDVALDPLAKGLSDMLITDLAGLSSLQVVERAKLNQVLSELKLSRSKFIDPKTAVKLGRGLAARFVLTGGYVVSADKLRIDVRLLEVETGKVLAAERVEGGKDEFFALEKELVDVLVKALALKLEREDKNRLRRNPTQSFDAFARYADGLDATDKGDAARAKAAFEQALSADPGYLAAKTALDRLSALFAVNDRATESYVDEEVRGLDPRSPAFAVKVEELLLRLDWGKSEQSKRKTKLLTWLGQQKLFACTKTKGPALGSAHVIIDGVPQGGVISHCRQVHEVLLIAYELMSDPSLWSVVPRLCERFIHQLPEDRALISYCENTLVPGIKELKAAEPAEATKHDAPGMKAMLAAYATSK